MVCGECAFKGQVIQMVKTGLAPEPTIMARKGRSFILTLWDRFMKELFIRSYSNRLERPSLQ